MAALAFGPKIAHFQAQLARLENEMAEEELRVHLAEITQLASQALAHRRDLTREERALIGLLTAKGDDTVQKVVQYCTKWQVRLLPMLMKCAPQLDLDTHIWKDKHQMSAEFTGFRESLGKNRVGVAEKILPGIFLSGRRACENCDDMSDDDDELAPFIISFLGSPEHQQEAPQGHKHEMYFTIVDDDYAFKDMLDATSEPDVFAANDWFEKTFKQIDQALLEKRRVLIHCHAGQSRSATFLATYLMKRFELTANQAVNFLIHKRKAVKPNPGFLSGLRHYERALRGLV